MKKFFDTKKIDFRRLIFINYHKYNKSEPQLLISAAGLIIKIAKKTTMAKQRPCRQPRQYNNVKIEPRQREVIKSTRMGSIKMGSTLYKYSLKNP